MEWIDTPESSTIARFAYDMPRSVLRVEFKHGGRYEYYDVPTSVFENMKTAQSRGQFLAKQIKGRYRYARA